MDIQGKTIWQQAAGDKDRNYVNICLRWNVILNGPSWMGPWPKHGTSAPSILRFCKDMMAGDIVVLRLGTDTVHAVGQIVGDYEYCEEFNDIDGWDIGHVRRVRWLWKSKQSPKKFPTQTLKWGDTTQRLKEDKSKKVVDWLKELEITNHRWTSELPELPKPAGDLSFEQVSEHMFNEGVASDSISSLMAQIDDFIRIANWYGRSKAETKKEISERETVCYLVVPLLRALGWTPQRMAIEWSRIDIALFSKLPRDKESVSVVVEAKRMDGACLSAFFQAKSYSKKYPNCNRIILTDGLRYGVYVRESGKNFDDKPNAYMNLTRLRDEYPVYECNGAREAILAMVPEWSG